MSEIKKVGEYFDQLSDHKFLFSDLFDNGDGYGNPQKSYAETKFDQVLLSHVMIIYVLVVYATALTVWI
jgi:hypothetical protein